MKFHSFVLMILGLVLTLPLAAQQRTDASLFGHVVANGEHIPFASIAVEGTTLGTTTDYSGHYHFIHLPEGVFTLRVSAVGYAPVEKEVIITKNHSEELNFELQPDVVALNQVVVSANRHETSRKDASVIVNTITPKVFESTNAVCLSDGMSFQPGLRVETNCQNCGFQQIRINGLDGPYTQILIDSRAVFSALSGVYGIEQIPASMIERVEVVRGGGSALFGSNAIGGTVNIITREPVYNSFEISDNLAVLDKNTLDHSLNANAALVTDDKKGGLFIFGALRDRDFYDHDNDGYSEIALLENTSFGFRSYYKPTLYSKISLEYHHLGEFRRGGNLFDLEPHEANIAEQVKHRINAASMEYSLLSQNHRSKISVFGSLQHTHRDSYYGAGQDPNAYGKTDDMALVAGTQFNHSFEKLLLAPADLTAGLEYQYNGLHDEMPGYNRNLSQDVFVYGLFAQNEWKTGKLNVLLGARAEKHNLLNDLIISPRANLLYKLMPSVSLRWSYAQGYRAPQAFDEDLHIEAVGGEVMLIQLADDLETELSHTFSTSLDFYTDALGIDANLLIEGFYTRLDRVFVLEGMGVDAEGNKLVERRNGAGAEVYGVNMESRLAIAQNMEAQLGFTMQESQYIEPEYWSDDESMEPTREMLRTPDYYGYFTMLVQPFSETELSFSGIYTGKMYVPHYAGHIENDVLVESDDFLELNIKASQTFRISNQFQVQINGGVKNLLNSYQNDFDQGAYRDSGYMYGPVSPRSFFIGVKIGSNL